jgi:high-affinity Fe2+/Pb2+ permease
MNETALWLTIGLATGLLLVGHQSPMHLVVDILVALVTAFVVARWGADVFFIERESATEVLTVFICSVLAVIAVNVFRQL